MDWDLVRVLVSGLVGSVVALWLRRYLLRWSAGVFSTKMPKPVKNEAVSAILIADALFFVCLIVNVAAYHFHYFDDHDWRGFFLFFGLGMMAPLIVLPFSALYYRKSFKEMFVAFSVCDGAMPGCLATVVGVGIFMVLISMIYLVRR